MVSDMGRKPLAVILLLIPVLAVLTYAALRQPLIGAGLLYVIVFATTVAIKPHLAPAFILMGAPFQNDLSSGAPAKFSIAELNLILTFVVLCLRTLARREKLTLGPITVPLLLYFAVCLFSSVVTWRGREAVISLLQMALYFVCGVAVLKSTVDDPRQLRSGLLAYAAVSTCLAVIVLASRSGYVLGIHKNGAGASLASAVLIATELWISTTEKTLRRILGISLLILSAALLVTLSRGAWLATLVGLFLIVVLRRQYGLLIGIFALAIPLAALGWMFLPDQSRDYVTDLHDSKFSSVGTRRASIDYAFNEFSKSPIFGAGVGLRKQYDATNIVMLTLAETGILGALAFLGIHLALFRMVWRGSELIERTDPLFSLLVVCLAVVAAKFVHGLLDHYWSRGPITIAWGSAGMATAAYEYAVTRYARRVS